MPTLESLVEQAVMPKSEVSPGRLGSPCSDDKPDKQDPFARASPPSNKLASAASSKDAYATSSQVTAATANCALAPWRP